MSRQCCPTAVRPGVWHKEKIENHSVKSILINKTGNYQTEERRLEIKNT